MISAKGLGWFLGFTACLATAAGQIGTEPVSVATAPSYDIAWAASRPGGNVPDWARPGKLRFARWDGGPIETAKAILSGWPNFSPAAPDVLYAMTNWYDLRTVKLLKEAGINAIWVTFSNGFSIATEKVQRDILGPYIAECHRQGIRVVAYESIANLFWEDMYERVPESRGWIKIGPGGKPVPYSAANYAKTGHVTRYMADLGNAGWRAYLKRRIDLAVDAGVDGIMYDNCVGDQVAEAMQDVSSYAFGRKPDFLLMANLHDKHFILNGLLNSVTTEEGCEAGVWSEAGVARSASIACMGGTTGMVRVQGGYLANDIGLLRLFDALSEGWKPTFVESNIREKGPREDSIMAAERQQRVMAETMTFAMANEAFVEDRFASELWKGRAEAKATWAAIGRLNRFFAENERCYVGARPVASLGILLDDRSEGLALLNRLAARNVQFHVLYERALTPEILKAHAGIAVLGMDALSERTRAALKAYVAGGGKLIAGDSSLAGAGELAERMRAADAAPAVRVEAPPGVLYNVARNAQSGRWMVHLINYTSGPAGECRARIRGKFRHVAVLTPDGADFSRHSVAKDGDATEIRLPGLKVYTVISLEE